MAVRLMSRLFLWHAFWVVFPYFPPPGGSGLSPWGCHVTPPNSDSSPASLAEFVGGGLWAFESTLRKRTGKKTVRPACRAACRGKMKYGPESWYGVSRYRVGRHRVARPDPKLPAPAAAATTTGTSSHTAL